MLWTAYGRTGGRRWGRPASGWSWQYPHASGSLVVLSQAYHLRGFQDPQFDVQARRAGHVDERIEPEQVDLAAHQV